MKIRPDLKVMIDPYSGEEYVIVPPIVPDVAIIHAFRGDRFGNIITDSFRNDRLLAMAATKSIAVVEDLVDFDDVLPGRYGVFVSGVHIDAVVHAPRGAHPTACRDRYGIDTGHLMTYLEAAKSDDSFREYLERYIIGPDYHDAYLNLIDKGGIR